MHGATFDDTIAAIATPAGRGAISVLRLAGPDAVPILSLLCPGASGEAWIPRRQRLVRVTHPSTGETIEHALVTFFAAPASYTGEDTVEFSCHGGDIAPQLVLDALLAAGARQAFPGEFTRRAVLNGKLDLLQAEAVVDLIDARSPAFHSAAIHQMERGLSARIVQLREEIIHAEALVSYGIDFPDEDEPPVPKETILASADAALRRIEMLIGSAPQGEMLRKGALVVLAGLPNSGKSSLFNALLGSDRAIVTEIPGTTRDAVEADATIEGYPFRLVDTAGLRETSDRVEALGIEVARRYLAAAELVLFCSPAGGSLETSERQFLQDVNSERVLVVRTKTDLIGGGAEPDPALNAVELSAHSGEGLGVLRERLVTRAFGAARMDFDSPLVTSERQLRALRSAAAEVRGFIDGLADEVPAEFAATHLRSAAEALEELIGAVTTDDVLSAIFGRFCVGK